MSIAGWMIDPVACVGMTTGSARVDLAALIEVNRLVTTSGGHCVHEPILDHELHAYPRMHFKEVVNERRKDIYHDRTGHIEPQQATHFMLRTCGILQGSTSFRIKRQKTFRQRPPCICR